MGRRGFAWGDAWLLIPALALLYIVIRCLHLDLFVTTDEPFWLGRSANFYRALRQDDFSQTYQMAHPGVMTMWAGMVAYLWSFPEYVQHVTINLNHVYGIDGVLRELGEDPMGILVTARIAKVMMQAIFFAVALFFLRRLFGLLVMVIAGVLIAFDPFVSGLDSLLHVDGLFAVCCLAALLAIAAAVKASPDAMSPWIVAGVLSACAWMTRATGILLVVIVIGIALVQVFGRRRADSMQSFRAALEAPAFGGMLWATGAIAASLLLLPALWVDPFGTMQQIWDWSSDAATDGHERPTFFLSEIHTGDPGLWFYPVTLLWRLTPISLLGVILFVALVPVARRRGWLTDTQLQSLLILIAFAGAYMVAMTVGAKKFDRYILPVYPIVSVIAAVGFVHCARLLGDRRPRWSRIALPAMVVLVIAGQASSLLGSAPYRLDYFNPLLGGLASAQDTVQVGWGEGGGEVMEFIGDDADGREVIVQTSSVTPVFSYLAPSNVRFDDFGLGTPAGWYETDYFVAGIQEWQRDLSPSYRRMQRFDPAHVVEIDGVPFFETWAPNQLPLPDMLRGPTGCTATFGEGLQLMQIIGRDGTIDLYWLTTGDAVQEELIARVMLTLPDAPDGELPVQEGRWVAAGEGLVSKVTVADPRPEDAVPLAEYTLMIQVADPSTGADLAVRVVGNEGVDDQFVTTSECYYAG